MERIKENKKKRTQSSVAYSGAVKRGNCRKVWPRKGIKPYKEMVISISKRNMCPRQKEESLRMER